MTKTETTATRSDGRVTVAGPEGSYVYRGAGARKPFALVWVNREGELVGSGCTTAKAAAKAAADLPNWGNTSVRIVEVTEA